MLFHASIKRAIVTYPDEELRNEHESQSGIEPIYGESSACVHLELANAYEGMRIVCMAITKTKVFSEKEVKVSIERDVASIMELMSNGDPQVCYVKTGTANISDSMASLSRDLASEDTEDVTIIPEAGAFCVCLYNLQKAQANTELMSVKHCWTPYSMMGPSFQSSTICRDLSKEDCKKLLKAMRDITVACDLVKVGRRKVGQNKCFVSVPWFDNQGIREDLSKEFYVCLTLEGRLFVQTFLHNKRRSKISPPDTKKEKEADIHAVLDACIPTEGSITEKASMLYYEKKELPGPAIAIEASQEEVMTKSEDIGCNNKGMGSVLSNESSPSLIEKDEALHLLPATTNDSSHVDDKTALDVIVPKEVSVSNYSGDESVSISDSSNEVVEQIGAVQATDSLAVGGVPQLRGLFERQICLLERQLQDVVATKDFQAAVLIQSNIDSLKQPPTVAVTQAVLVMLKEELDEAIAKRDFSSATIVQSYIENLEKYITSTTKCV
eukprot:scaffold37080_cov48-Attheya_sp.AAC.1